MNDEGIVRSAQESLFIPLIQWIEHESERPIFDEVIDDFHEKAFASEKSVLSQRFFLRLFEFIKHIEPSDFTQIITRRLTAECNYFNTVYPEESKKIFPILHAYFSQLSSYLKKQIDTEDKNSFVSQLSSMLSEEYNPDLYEYSSDALDTLKLTAGATPLGLCERIRIFSVLASEQFKTQISEISDLSSVVNGFFSGMSEAMYERMKEQLNSMVPRDAKRVAVKGEIKIKMNLIDQWRSLSRGKKVAFTTFVTLGIIASLVVGIVLPGTHLITIPALAILSTKLLGSLAVWGSSVAGSLFFRRQEQKRLASQEASGEKAAVSLRH